jgi:hypothetical protein
MNYQKLFQQMMGATLVTFLLVGCGASEGTGEPQARPTIIQTALPTSSPKPIPTFTPVLPTSPPPIVVPPSDTPNPIMETLLPSEQIDLPDLVIRWNPRVLFNPGTCGWSGGQITISFDNIGAADAGPFAVSIKGQTVGTVDGLPAGKRADASTQYNGVLGGITARVDVYDEVIERDETNNTIGITHTPPPTCTTTPTATMTATPIP